VARRVSPDLQFAAAAGGLARATVDPEASKKAQELEARLQAQDARLAKIEGEMKKLESVDKSVRDLTERVDKQDEKNASALENMMSKIKAMLESQIKAMLESQFTALKTELRAPSLAFPSLLAQAPVPSAVTVPPVPAGDVKEKTPARSAAPAKSSSPSSARSLEKQFTSAGAAAAAIAASSKKGGKQAAAAIALSEKQKGKRGPQEPAPFGGSPLKEPPTNRARKDVAEIAPAPSAPGGLATTSAESTQDDENEAMASHQ